MAHHQHHGADYFTQAYHNPSSQPTSTHMPVISEDEMVAEVDEPPDYCKRIFEKTRPARTVRRESLLTAALHTDSESHHEDDESNDHFQRQPSRSSTCSNFSGRSGASFTSDEGQTSAGTRASTPSSPPHNWLLKKSFTAPLRTGDAQIAPLHALHQVEPTKPQATTTSNPATEPVVEAGLGRKRCISFACGKRQDPAPPKVVEPETEQPQFVAEPPKRACTLKFVCPSKFFAKGSDKDDAARPSRRLSPAPLGATLPDSPKPAKRSHRGSDSTIKLDSPKAARKSVSIERASKINSDLDMDSEATRFHEFAGSEGEEDEWVQESTCFKSPLTIDDTLKKENNIRQLGEEAEEEALQEEEEDEDDEDDANFTDYGGLSGEEPSLSDDNVSEGGFQTDDEEGFAESDDDEAGSDSDYEWWAPRKTKASSPFVTSAAMRVRHRSMSDDSLASHSSQCSPRQTMAELQRSLPQRKSSRSIPVRPKTPENMPDSTDFVCGTLDEDRPLEEAFKTCVEQRKAMKHRATPQDIDPTFPTSDPDICTDESDNDDVVEPPAEHDHTYLPGKLENIHEVGVRGRSVVAPTKAVLASPKVSPRRGPVHRSPPPPGFLFGRSPRHLRSPPTSQRLTSPPPSRRGSMSKSPTTPRVLPQPTFLGQRPQPTHTASLPRSPAPFCRRRKPSPAAPCNLQDVSENDGYDTPREKQYTRGAIDIVQGLESKRLRRRLKFYEKYCRKEKKREEKARKPLPGKGAERMRQVGIECAVYRGKRVLSI